jgi:hypothetical protein
MTRLFVFAALSTLAFGCVDPDPEDDLGEGTPDAPAVDSVGALPKADQTAPGDPSPAVPLQGATGYLDLRGVGDAAWSRTHQREPLAAEFGAALDRWDSTGASYRGDINFINWETVVAERCDRFWAPYNPGRAYAFVSRAENLAQAYDRGFNLVGLSNNHTRDCYDDSADGQDGVDRTLAGMESLDEGRSWLWHGVGREDADKVTPTIGTFEVQGRPVRVAFASLYVGRVSCPRATCQSNAPALLEALGQTNADLRILSIHSQGSHDKLIRFGRQFIEEYGGDVVFGHGPHKWKPVHVINKPGGGRGVMFESLGNFIHPNLRAQSKNIVGRALLDLQSLELVQVQAKAVQNTGYDAVDGPADPTTLEANITWTADAVVGAYADIARDPIVAGELGCIEGFNSMQTDAGGRYCDDGSHAAGAITEAMRATCLAEGAEDCEARTWERETYLARRGEGLCPAGAWFDPRTRYCVEAGDSALGPFPEALVLACLSAEQEPALCQGDRWPQRLLFELTQVD